MSDILVSHIHKKLGNVVVLDDVDFEVEGGAIAVIFGPNGSGKSTLLNIIAGIVLSDRGSVTAEKIKKHDISYIFQNYRDSLLPWKTNYKNISFPLEIRGYSQDEIQTRIRKLQDVFEFQCDWNAYPYELSGGQQQILAFMRALITNPKLLLIDEPFSALDYENNLVLRKHLLHYHETYKPTIIAVTHNTEEAVHLSNRVIVLGKKPTKVKRIVKNNIPFPRDLEVLASEHFHRIKDEVLNAFKEAVKL